MYNSMKEDLIKQVLDYQYEDVIKVLENNLTDDYTDFDNIRSRIKYLDSLVKNEENLYDLETGHIQIKRMLFSLIQYIIKDE